MATRAEIEARMADILNRTDFSARITIWFDRAYTSLQRRHDFKAMEVTEELAVTAGMTEFPVPGNIKQPRLLYLWDTTTQKRIKNFREGLLEEVKEAWNLATSACSCEPVYTNWYGTLLFAPAITPLEAGQTLRFDYYRYCTPVDNDWFMTYAEDWLVYRGLAESAPFLGADPRLQVWQAFAKEIYDELWKANVNAQTGSGPLQLKG